MKILFACNSYYPAIGGAEKACKNLVRILSKEGKVTVLTKPHPKRKDKTNIVELQAKTSYSYMPKLKEFLEKNDFDLYISYGHGKYFTDYIGYWAKKHNKPSIVFPCGYFHTKNNWLFKKIYSFLITRWSLNNFFARVVATEWEKAFWNTHFNVKLDNTFVIPYNLEPNFTKFKKTQILKKYKLKKKQYILYIGRREPNKLIDLLVEAYKKTNRTIPLVIAGKGNPNLNLLKTENILYIGEISENDKKTLIKNAKLTVFPSSYESFGLVLLESIALGTPTIGSNIPPFQELLKTNELLFENNVDSLAKKLSTNLNYHLPEIALLNEEIYIRKLIKIIMKKYPNKINESEFFETRAQSGAEILIWLGILGLIIILGIAILLNIIKMTLIQ